MRIQVSHETVYRYGQPARGVIQTLRLTPRNHESQYVLDWRIDVSENCQVDQHEDAFGNITHAFTADGPFSDLAVMVEGEVETRDTQGIVRGAVERFPPALYLRETALTSPDAKIVDFAAACRDEAGGKELGLLHIVLERLHHLLKLCFCLLMPFFSNKTNNPWHSLLSFRSLMRTFTTNAGSCMRDLFAENNIFGQSMPVVTCRLCTRRFDHWKLATCSPEQPGTGGRSIPFEDGVILRSSIREFARKLSCELQGEARHDPLVSTGHSSEAGLHAEMHCAL